MWWGFSYVLCTLEEEAQGAGKKEKGEKITHVKSVSPQHPAKLLPSEPNSGVSPHPERYNQTKPEKVLAFKDY
jgi:hypothetical protein